MTLAEFMKANDLNDREFAELVNRDLSNVWRWRHGKTLPDVSCIRDIYAATNGQVTANDFFHPATEAAE